LLPALFAGGNLVFAWEMRMVDGMGGAEAAWVASDNVVAADLGEGMALLNLATNEYFSLNEVGAFVWGILQTPRLRADVVRAVMDAYEVAEGACAVDVDLLLEELRHAALAEQRLVPAP
jgi:hypothetical protein